MDNDGFGKVMKFGFECVFYLVLNVEVVILYDFFKEGIDKSNKDDYGGYLWLEVGVFGDVFGNDGWNGGGKCG